MKTYNITSKFEIPIKNERMWFWSNFENED